MVWQNCKRNNGFAKLQTKLSLIVSQGRGQLINRIWRWRELANILICTRRRATAITAVDMQLIQEKQNLSLLRRFINQVKQKSRQSTEDILVANTEYQPLDSL